MEDQVRNDNRFSHIANDPRFRRLPRVERKVKIDKRFQSMFNDGLFKVQYPLDKRGRPGKHTSSEDLKRYYELSSDSDTTDESEDSEDDEHSDKEESNKIEKKRTVAIRDDRSSESNSDVESSNVDLGVTGKSEPENFYFSDMLSEEVKIKLHNKKVDYARGEGVLVSDSSSDEESSEGELEADVRQLDHQWSELDRDAEHTAEITNQLALCNMDWDRIRAVDIMVLLNSFLPLGGVINSVKIYPSEFGLERMKQEELSGPVELRNKDGDQKYYDEGPEDKPEDKEESIYHMEKLRNYQLNRLKYFYAVITFDSASSANKVYTECDGMEYEASASRLDLRFIPDDTTFDQEPRDECDRVPDPTSYKPRAFTTTALQMTSVELTWDETDPVRGEITKKIAEGTADEKDLKAYLASSSEEEEEDEPDNVAEPKETDSETETDNQKPADPIAKYRALLSGIVEQEESNKNRGVEMEVTWGLGLKKEAEKMVSRKMKEGKEGLTPFQELMEKKRAKNRLKKLENDKKKIPEDGDKGDDNLYSDDDIPSDVDMNDPFFAEERGGNTEPSKNKLKKERKKQYNKEEEDEEAKQRKAELELLLMGEHEEKNHFSLKQIQETEKAQSGKKKFNKMKWRKDKELKAKNDADDFEVNVKDDRFSALFSSHHYNIDPTDPHYHKTKGMEALRNEKLNRRIDEEVPRKIPKVDVKQKNDRELSLLVKSVKSKTQGKFRSKE